ncbi:MAG: hypothetical protein QOE70_4612 [Chthoniobacter sp.]|jgi:hypothetical protein|nr:hypothetical protein [Chthoniobacter sp.]
MKTKTDKQPKQPKPATKVKDLKPKKDPKGGHKVSSGHLTLP